MLSHRIRSYALVTLALLIVTRVSFGQAPETADHYFYFKERTPLNIDVSRVAVFLNTTDKNESKPVTDATVARERIASALQSAKMVGRIEPLKLDTLSASAIPGRYFVDTTDSHKSRSDIRDFVQRLSTEKGVDFVSPVFLDGRNQPIVMTPHILIGFDRSLDASQAEAVLAAEHRITIVDRDWDGMKRAYRLLSTSRSGFDVLETANALAQRPEVKFAEPDMMITGHSSMIPNDPGFGNCWGIHNTGQLGGVADMDMDGPEAWDITTGDDSIIVVVIDTGVQQDHPDIHQITGTDTTNDPGSIGDGGPVNACDNHGTAVAGCISATINNNLGTVGIAPGVVVASARTFISNPSCNGSWSANFSWTVDTLAWAETIGARVTNNSNTYGYGNASAAVTQKYQDTRDNGMIHFSSAHNDGIEMISFPANLPTVNAVSAVGEDGTLTNFSNFGNGIAFAAPGIDVYTTDRTGSAGWTSGDYTFAWGTSFASPYTAGVAALVLSAYPALSPDQVELAMRLGAVDIGDPGYDILYGYGFVNALGALINAAPAEPCELQKITASDGVAGDEFGGSISISENVMAVGAASDSCAAGGDCGAVYVYRRSGIAWTEEQKLVAADAGAGDTFGRMVSLSGNVIVVGAYHDDDNGADSGSAYVFRYDPSASACGQLWCEEQKLLASDGSATDEFGNSVTVSGDNIIIGARSDDDNGSNSGSAYAYRWDGSTWNEQPKLLPSDGSPSDQFGISVSIAGDVAVVGAYFDDDLATDAGSAYIFRWNGSGWTQEQKLLASDGQANDLLGGTVSIYDDVAILNSRDDDNGTDAGAAYVFRNDPTLTTCGQLWCEEQKLIASDGQANDYFSHYVGAGQDVAILGAFRADDNGTDSGAAYVFRWNGSIWTEEHKLLMSDGVAGDEAGFDVAVSNEWGVVGARLDDDNGIDSGSVYAFAIAGDCNLNLQTDLCEILDDPALDLDNDGILNVCDCLPIDPPLADPTVVQSSRYISCQAPNPGETTALRVTFTDLDGDYSIWNGLTMWVSDPQTVTELSGSAASTPLPTFTAATLSCQKDCRDWGSLGLIDIFAEGIVPNSTFDIQAVKCGGPADYCMNEEANFSTPLALSTSKYGDLVGSFDAGTCSWTAPDGSVSVPFDTVADIDKFTNKACAARKARTDLVGVPPNQGCVDQIIGVSDYVATIEAFQGHPYPYSPTDPDPCNALPCPNP